MRHTLLVFVMAALFVACQAQQPSTEAAKTGAASKIDKASLKSSGDKLNYSVGYEIGKNIKRNGLPLAEPVFMKGIHDGMEEKEPLISEEDMRQVKMDHSKAQREIREKEREAEGKKNKEAGEKFLKENAKKEGVVTTESGLQYKILKEGKGDKPAETDRVSVNYKGTLIDGTEFDSSYTRNKPASFAVNRVVKGWTEGLQLMPVGSKWQFVIPPELGYGPRGAGAKIGPNAVLIFEVELVEIEKPDPNKKPGPPGGPGGPGGMKLVPRPGGPGGGAKVVPNPVKKPAAQ